jgi:uncharacterized phage-associated protein
MFLKFNAEKAVQAAGVLLRQEPGKHMTRLRLLKLLYIADRKSLRETGRPILGSKISAMDNGPLHSDVYNLIKGEHVQEHIWAKHFANDGPQELRIVDEPPVGLLSKPEIAMLRKVSEMHEQYNDFELSKMTHQFPEFGKHYAEGTSVAIPLEDVIDGVGRNQDKAEILQDLKDDDAFDKLFERIRT